MNIKATGKWLAMLLFHTSRRNGDEWTCDPCKEAVWQPGIGYAHLVSHIRRNHDELITDQLQK